MKIFQLIAIFISLLIFSEANSQTITILDSGKKTSLRGLSVVNQKVAWISGSNGYTARTTDAGKTWNWKQLQGYEKLDFRDIEAFSANSAIIVSAGSPAIILKTVNGGKTWKEVYRNESADIFLDGMGFWNSKKGIIYGDPIGGHMQLLYTDNSGNSWTDVSSNLNIPLLKGEASFAASGTAIRTLKGGQVYIATGGTQSRLFYSDDYGRNWTANQCPIIQGENSTGPFSISFLNKNLGIAAGGDYLRDTSRNKNAVITKNGGKSWETPAVDPFGYRSAVEYITDNLVVCTGPTGTDVSYDGGLTWKNISDEGFNTVQKSCRGNLILLTGSQGKIARLKF